MGQILLLSGIFVLMFKIMVDMSRISKFFSGTVMVIDESQLSPNKFYKQ